MGTCVDPKAQSAAERPINCRSYSSRHAHRFSTFSFIMLLILIPDKNVTIKVFSMDTLWILYTRRLTYRSDQSAEPLLSFRKSYMDWKLHVPVPHSSCSISWNFSIMYSLICTPRYHTSFLCIERSCKCD